MENTVMKAGGWFVLAVLAWFFAAMAVDMPYAVHMGIFGIAALLAAWFTISNKDYSAVARGILKMPDDQGVYYDDVVRWVSLPPYSGGSQGFWPVFISRLSWRSRCSTSTCRGPVSGACVRCTPRR